MSSCVRYIDMFSLCDYSCPSCFFYCSCLVSHNSFGVLSVPTRFFCVECSVCLSLLYILIVSTGCLTAPFLSYYFLLPMNCFTFISKSVSEGIPRLINAVSMFLRTVNQFLNYRQKSVLIFLSVGFFSSNTLVSDLLWNFSI